MSVADRSAGEKAKQGGIWETIKVVVEALLIALVFRTFLFHPFNIPSGSMEPTLLIGDYLFVSKFSYGYSRYSFPFDLAFIDGRIWEGVPERGDIVVFRPPREPGTDYIKRVIGLPGDRIQVQRRRALHQRRGGPARAGRRVGGRRAASAIAPITQYRETLTNGVSYITLDMTDERAGRQHARLRGAARPLFPDGRQPRQFAGQPLPRRAGRLRAGGEPRRPRRDHLLLRRRSAGLGVLEVAVVGAAGPHLRSFMTTRELDRLQADARPSLRQPGPARARADPCERGRTAAGASRPISGWNSSATACSASSSPTCWIERFPEAPEGELSRRLAPPGQRRDLRRGGRRDGARRLSADRRTGREGRRARDAGRARRCLRGGDRAVYRDGGLAAARGADRALLAAAHRRR